MGFPGGSDSEESALNVGDLGSIPGLGRSPGGENGNPLQYSCLENPHGQRCLAGCGPWGRRVRTGLRDWALGTGVGEMALERVVVTQCGGAAVRVCGLFLEHGGLLVWDSEGLGGGDA